MMKQKIREIIEEVVSSLYAGNFDTKAFGDYSVERTSNSKFGDYSTNVAFVLAKTLKMIPDKIAQDIAGAIDISQTPELERVEVVGGYINFFLSQSFLHEQLILINRSKTLGHSKIGDSKKVIVEYSQPNIAKKMHIGHLRTTVMGDALANLFEMTGYKTIRWNYLGDWGTQFGKLIAAYKLWGSKKEVQKNPIQALLDLYVRFHAELKTHPELEKRGQVEFKKLEDGDRENKKLWQWFKKESLKEFNRIYKMLDIKFDIWIGESFYESQMEPLVKELTKKGVAVSGETGSMIINLDKYNLPPALVQKSDGASLYLTRDVANLKYRLAKYHPAKILYVVANEQSLHFKQLFAVAEILSLNSAELFHVKYGLVLGENKKKMATREGESIPLEDVIDEAVRLAHDIVSKKNPGLSAKEKSAIAKTVALGALKYEMLKDNRNSDIIFDWNQILDFSGNSGPYLQYTYARLASIIHKARGVKKSAGRSLVTDAQLTVIKKLIDFPEVVSNITATYAVNSLALYLFELANLLNALYEKEPILTDPDPASRNDKLLLISTANVILKKGLNLLGIQTLERI